ncbi:MAG: hypothetical protein QW133_07035 [Sulfolobales archaeon]
MKLFKAWYCGLCYRDLHNVRRYRVMLCLRSGPLKGVEMKRFYVCGDCLTKLKEDVEVRRRFKIRYKRLSNIIGYEWPYKDLHDEAVRLKPKVLLKIKEVEEEIEEKKALLSDLFRELKSKYGPGYITVKSVRNSSGKRYSYVVYRTKDGKDHYLGESYADIIKVRSDLRTLKRILEKLLDYRTELEYWIRATRY